MIQPFETLDITGLYTVSVMIDGLNVMIEGGEEPFSDSVTTVNSYSHIKQGFKGVPLELCNITCRAVTIPAKTVVTKISAASEVLHRLAPKFKEREDAEIELNPIEPEKLKHLFEKFHHIGISNGHLRSSKNSKMVSLNTVPYSHWMTWTSGVLLLLSIQLN